MPLVRHLKYSLHACRRILLLVVLVLTLAGGWFYLQAPSLNELRPELVGLLKQELKLSKLELGNLSWYWAGSTWVYAEDVSFTTKDKQVQVKNGRLDVQISSWDLLAGRITPLSINLRGGQLSVQIPKVGAPGILALPLFRLDLEDVQLAWRYGKNSGDIDHLHLHLDAIERQLALQLPGVNLMLDWDKNMLPVTLDGQFEDTRWMPAILRQYLQGHISGKVYLQHTGAEQWHVQAKLHSATGAELTNGHGQALFRFDAAEAAFSVQTVVGTAMPREISIEHFAWHDGDSSASVSGRWRNGMLHLDLGAGRLAMAKVWPWLVGLEDGEAWRKWVSSMHRGRASLKSGSIEIGWPMLHGPGKHEWEAARYSLSARISGADLTLVNGEPGLTDLDATLSLDEEGMQADITKARLPGEAGLVHGRLVVADWSNIVLDTSGSGKVDMGRLQAWLQARPVAGLEWKSAPATGSFSFKWLPAEDEPRSGHIRLEPADAWQATLHGRRLQLSGGILTWDAGSSITLDGMHFQSALLSGAFSLSAARDNAHAWHIVSLKGEASGDFSGLVKAGEIPVDAPAGTLHAQLSFGRGWHSEIDFKDAAWGHLLGTAKPSGVPFSVNLSGTSEPSVISISRIRSTGTGPQLKGNGTIGTEYILLNFARVKTPAIDTTLHIRAPFGAQPLEVDIQASFMSRQALPRQLKYTPGQGKAWALRARIAQLIWDGAMLYHADVQLASSKQRIGLLRAARLVTARLNLTNAVASFRLPREGVIELREMSAMLAKQKLQVTGTFTSRPEGGLYWQGFANINGDFGYMLNRLDASHKFRTGDMRALISGQGLLLPDQPWWYKLDGRLRLRVNDGRILEGGTMTKLLAAASLADLPGRFMGKHKDLVGEGMHFHRLQLEAGLHGRQAKIRQLAIRASALDMAGQGKLDLEDGFIDLTMVLRPLQNLDAVLKAIPLLRDILGGASHSLMRKVYHVHGPLSAARTEEVSPEEAGLAAPGLVESLIKLPGRWFGTETPEPAPQ